MEHLAVNDEDLFLRAMKKVGCTGISSGISSSHGRLHGSTLQALIKESLSTFRGSMD